MKKHAQVLVFWCLIFCSTILSSNAQTKYPFHIWDKTIGGSGQDELSQVLSLPDGGFLVAGSSGSDISYDQTQNSRGGDSDYWIVRLDAQRNILWDKRFGGNHTDRLNKVLPLQDGGFLLGGNSNSGISGDKSDHTPYQGSIIDDWWIVRIDAQGNKIWDKTFGIFGDDELNDMLLLPDGGFLLGGKSSGTFKIIKINSSGNAIWTKSFAGNNREELKKLLLLSDGGYLLGGWSDSYQTGDKSQNSQGSYDFWIIKTDAQGNKIWDKTLGGNRTEFLTSMILLPNDQVLLGGLSNSDASGDKSQGTRGQDDYWIVKMDAQGNKIWDKTFGGSGSDFLNDLLLIPNQGYLLVGSSYSTISPDKTQNSNGLDAWIIKVDTSGNKIWDRTIGGGPKQNQNIGSDFASSAILLADGSYLVGGFSDAGSFSEKREIYRGDYDWWLVNIQEDNSDQEFRVYLHDARSEKSISRIYANDIFNLREIGTTLLSIEARTRLGVFESVKLELTGAITAQKTENQTPYTLFGKNTANDFLGRDFTPGQYTLSVTPYAQDQLQGVKGETITLPFTLVENAPTSLSKLILVNSDTDQDIRILQDGDTIGFTNTTTRLSIRAETEDKRIQSVFFKLSGPINHTQIENIAPYALFGGDPFNINNYYGKYLPNGDYTLEVTPYEGTNLSGAKGVTTTINFSRKLSIDRLVLVDASNKQEIAALSNGTNTNCGDQISILAETLDPDIQSIKFRLQGPHGIIERIENLAPYTLLGESTTGDYLPFKTLGGNYQLTVTPYTQDNAQGIAGIPVIVNFKSTGLPEIYNFTLIDAGTDQEIGTIPLFSTTSITVPVGGLSIRANTNTCTGGVTFTVRNANGAIVLNNTERQTPYALNGNIGEDYTPWFPPAPGTYRFRCVARDNDNIDRQFIDFSLIILSNNTNQNAITLYPNPSTQDRVHLSLDTEGAAHKAQLTVRDKQGNVVLEQSISEKELDLNIQGLQPGYYLIEVQTAEGILRKPLIKH